MAKIITTRDQEKVTLVDEATADITYVGIAKLGTATSDAKWQIRRIQKIVTVTSIQYADGDRRFNNEWDNRASLSYSN